MSEENLVDWQPNLAVKVGAPEGSPFKPYHHQLAAWDALEKYYHDDGKLAGILVVPTGGGKTAIAARWLLKNHIGKGGRVLWFAHRRSLLRQACRTFAEAAHLAAPKKQLKLVTVSSEDCKWSSVAKEHDVVFSSVQSAVREGNFGFLDLMAKQSPAGLIVVIDEAHHASAPGYLRVLGELQKRRAPLLGLTATPVRMDESDEKRLWNLFQGIVYEIDKKTLFNNGILATPDLETVNTKIEFEREFTPADYAHLSRFGELGPAVLTRLAKHAGRNRLIVEHYLGKRDYYGQTIVFAADTLHAQTLAAEFNKHEKGLADYVDYSRKDSHAVMAAFRDQAKPKVLVNVEMLTEGFDAPKTRTVFIVRPTRSEALLSQMIGRALRGLAAGGTAEAHLVTFLDTWQQFDVLDTEIVVRGGPVEPPPGPKPPTKLIPVSAELIREAYRLVQSNVRGSFEGVHQCLPYGWYIWEEEFENDVQRRLVLVFENQRAGYAAFDAEYTDISRIAEEVSEDLARDLVRRFFADSPDPLPRWSDLQAILRGRKKGCQLVFYTFEEKKDFDPAGLARRFLAQDTGPQKQEAELRALWDGSGACQLIYLNDFKAFVEDVHRELADITPGGSVRRTVPPVIIKNVPKGRAKRWPEGEPGYSLTELKDAVLEQPRHFGDSPPLIRELRYASSSMTGLWGFYQYANKAVVINPELNSPEVPRYVMEFLLYHELLHADMPSAGHNRDYRARERLFVPSAAAVADAEARGHVPGTSKDAWRVLSEQFLDTFEEYFALRPPGTRVGM